MAKMKDNLPVGRADVSQTAPSHISGVHEGNAPGAYEKMAGHQADGTATARRSTGINPDGREPIMPGMPRLTPA
ncbi:MAG: hypothetical protein ACODAB_10290 [Gemmatimonadota bacterium]